MSSSRLPGKVLADINGAPALTRLLRRLRRCERLDDIILATTVAPADDALEAWAEKEGVTCHRGSEEDVLRRVVEAQQKMNSDIIVEVTGDCILTDPEIIDMGIETFLVNDVDAVSSGRIPSYPIGFDINVFWRDKLEWVDANINDPAVREHVSLYFYENPDEYRIIHVPAPPRWRGPNWRFHIDYPEDLEFVRTIYARLEPEFGDAFGIEDIMALLRREPSLRDINKDLIEKAQR